MVTNLDIALRSADILMASKSCKYPNIDAFVGQSRDKRPASAMARSVAKARMAVEAAKYLNEAIC